MDIELYVKKLHEGTSFNDYISDSDKSNELTEEAHPFMKTEHVARSKLDVKSPSITNLKETKSNRDDREIPFDLATVDTPQTTEEQVPSELPPVPDSEETQTLDQVISDMMKIFGPLP